MNAAHDHSPGNTPHTPDYAALVDASPYPYLLMDTSLMIIGANRAYLDATARTADIIGQFVFDAFPLNPDDPDSTSIETVRASLLRAIATKVPHTTAFLRFAVPIETAAGKTFDERYWSAVHTPVLNAAGEVTGMEHHATAGWPTQVMAPFFMPKGTNGEPFDPFSIMGAAHWYAVGAHRLRAVSNDLANDTFRPGWLRSVGSGWVNWALETFMDEAADKAGKDPIEFRLGLLTGAGKNAGEAPNSVGGASRQANVLRRVKELSGWGQALPEGTGLGVATTYGQERDMPTWTACVARVRVDKSTGQVTLEKLTLVTDAGTIVHPDGARAQVEGAALWGVSMALHEGSLIENGQVRDTNLNSYTPLRMRDVPQLEIEFIDSTEAAVGLGEPATTVTGPAIGNAIFNAVGVRMRDLPIRREAVLAALQA